MMNIDEVAEFVAQIADDEEVLAFFSSPSIIMVFHNNNLEMKELIGSPFKVWLPATDAHWMHPIVYFVDKRELVPLDTVLERIGRLDAYRELLPQEDSDPARLNEGVELIGYPRLVDEQYMNGSG